MDRYSFNAEDVISELNEFNRKICDASTLISKKNDIDVAPSPRDEVLCSNIFKLYHYQPTTHKKAITPILINYALVNRPYILDLQPDRSFIKHLLDEGFDVYLIDWGYPQQKDKFLSLDDYINGFMHTCIKHIQRETCLEKINLMGVCQGGVLNLCYASIYPNGISNLICVNTPVDFNTKHDRLSHFAKHIKFDQLANSHGLIPGTMLNLNLISTNPLDFVTKKYANFSKNIDDKDKSDIFLRIEKWSFDCPDQPGTAFSQFCTDFYQQNKLLSASIMIGEHCINLKEVSTPILNIFSDKDKIVPQESSKALKGATSTTDYHEIISQGGHISSFISKKNLTTLPKKISEWLMQRDIF